MHGVVVWKREWYLVFTFHRPRALRNIRGLPGIPGIFPIVVMAPLAHSYFYRIFVNNKWQQDRLLWLSSKKWRHICFKFAPLNGKDVLCYYLSGINSRTQQSKIIKLQYWQFQPSFGPTFLQNEVGVDFDSIDEMTKLLHRAGLVSVQRYIGCFVNQSLLHFCHGG